MDQFPTSDEEFELMYGEDLELMREQEQINEPSSKARKSLDFSTVKDNSIRENVSLSCKDTSINDFAKLPQTEEVSTKKRTIQELFGDIDDLLDCNSKKRARTIYSDMEMIDHIIELRRKTEETQNGNLSMVKTRKSDNAKDNLSYNVPRYPFLAVTRHDGERIYIRCHSEQYETQELKEITQNCSFKTVAKNLFKDIWRSAQGLLNKRLDETQNSKIDLEADVPLENNSLWVELYKPRKYMELLSDETINRTMLKWMKLWDKVVFNRRPKIKMGSSENVDGGKFRNLPLENLLKLDEGGLPEYKIALLCGPPGLGKTTLAHMVSRHCGYNVIEINASDDRSTDTFKTILKNATQMTSVVDRENRPNCIVFDEIDGAPSSSIDFLVKFVTGKTVKKSKRVNEVLICKRPIICICNDLYVPALKSLRQVAFVVNFPPTTCARLAERLIEIARHQTIKTDLGALMALCEKTGNDIRACLSVLHFFKSLNKPLTLSDVWKTSIGQKDQQKGLFSVWNDIFWITTRKTVQQTDFTLKDRFQRVLGAVNSFGDYERLAQGVFENYPAVKIRDPTLCSTCAGLDWFGFTDRLNKLVYTMQNYTLSTYLQYAFVVWHFVFGSTAKPKITFPNRNFEIKSRQERINAILTELLRSITPSRRVYLTSLSLKLDILPLISKIISPEFRAVNVHLFTEDEKAVIKNVVGIMADYNLTYIQERNSDGIYVYNIEPNIDEVITFPDLARKTNVPHAMKQLIAFEVQAERARRDFKLQENCQEQSKQEPVKEKEKTEKASVKEQTEACDFFGRQISRKSPETVAGKISPALETENDIWYHFNEGYSNALKKPIKIVDLK